MKDETLNLRPLSFDDYIGQSKLKSKLNILISSAKNREEALDHILLYGPPGLGKTTVARLIANAFGTELKITSGPVIEKVGDIAALLMSLKDKDFLFIDEIHSLNKSAEEMLYSAMEDRCVDVLVGKGPTARSIRIKLKPFTLIGATTNSSLLTSPLRDRFGFLHRLDYYSTDDLVKIVLRNSNLLGMKLSDKAAMKLADICRGTPRIANRFLKRVRDFSQFNNLTVINEKTIDQVLHMLDTDVLGLDVLDREILDVIVNKYSGGPVGINAIAAMIGEDRRTIEHVHEPYLVKIGLIERTRKGRKITKLGYEHLKRLNSKASDKN